jgi:hypothetical protein
VALEAQTKPRRPLSVSIDPVADAAMHHRRVESGATELRCDVCDAPIEGEPAGRGLYMWTRGAEARFEEPALCDRCATTIGVSALDAWRIEDESG